MKKATLELTKSELEMLISAVDMYKDDPDSDGQEVVLESMQDALYDAVIQIEETNESDNDEDMDFMDFMKRVFEKGPLL